MADPAPSHQSELADALRAMSGLDYVRAEEVAAIPVITREIKYVVYGPLAQFPLDPHVILLFADAGQGLIISEAVARVRQGGAAGAGTARLRGDSAGVNGGSSALSLGCCGARAYLDASSDGIAMWAFPGNKLEEYCAAIDTLARANKTLTLFHTRRREDIEAGKQPTVRQSLERLSS